MKKEHVNIATLPLLLQPAFRAASIAKRRKNESPNGLVKTSAVNPVRETRSRKECRTAGKRLKKNRAVNVKKH
jgi:hypothetical protein